MQRMVWVVGIGIETARVLDSEDFNGVALQGAGKYGKYIPVKKQKSYLESLTLTATSTSRVKELI